MNSRRLFRDRAEAERLAAPGVSSAPLVPADVDLSRIHISGEAESRYRERFRPDLSYRDAHDDLRRRMVEHGVVQVSPPRWVMSFSEAVGYVVVDEDVALPLRWHRSRPGTLVAVTCLFTDQG
jgi:hypothetical protein